MDLIVLMEGGGGCHNYLKPQAIAVFGRRTDKKLCDIASFPLWFLLYKGCVTESDRAVATAN